MTRKVHFTESQLNEIMDRLDEMNNNSVITYDAANSFKNMPLADGIDVAKRTAQQYPAADVFVNGKKVDSTTNTMDMANQMKDDAKDISDGISESKATFTKKQLKEAKLKYLRENSVSYSKKDFTAKMLGK